MTAIGLLLLWKAVKRADTLLSGRALLGAIFLGWGLFNFFEGLIDHHILNLHHVVKRLGVSIYDYAFLAPGVIFVIASVLSIRGVPPDAVEVRRA